MFNLERSEVQIEELLGKYKGTDVEKIIDISCKNGGIISRCVIPEKMKQEWCSAQKLRLKEHSKVVFESSHIKIHQYSHYVIKAFAYNPCKIDLKVQSLVDRCLVASLVLSDDKFNIDGVNLRTKELISLENKRFKISSFIELLDEESMLNYDGLIGYRHERIKWKNVIVPPWGLSRWIDSFVRLNRYHA